MIKMELANTDLEKIIYNKLILNYFQKYIMLLLMIQVLYNLKKKKIYHFDIKP